MTSNMTVTLMCLALIGMCAAAPMKPSPDAVVPEKSSSMRPPAWVDLVELSAKTGNDYCGLCHEECAGCMGEECGCPSDWTGDTDAACEEAHAADDNFESLDVELQPKEGGSKRDACKTYCKEGGYCATACGSSSESATATRETLLQMPDLVQVSAKTGTDYCGLCHDECPSCMGEDGCPSDWTGDSECACESAHAEGDNFESIDVDMQPVTGGSKRDGCKKYCVTDGYCPTSCKTSRR